MIKWHNTTIPELSYSFIGGFRVERLATCRGHVYCIGTMERAFIKFNSEYSLYKFLTL